MAEDPFLLGLVCFFMACEADCLLENGYARLQMLEY